MELLDGHTLREELTWPIPTRKAIEWGVQIANGVASGHEKGASTFSRLPPNEPTPLDDDRRELATR